MVFFSLASEELLIINAVLLKRIVFLFCCFSTLMQAQDYLDILNVGYSYTFNAKFEGTNETTDVHGFDANLTVPLVINDNIAFITGGNFSTHSIQLDPNFNKTTLNSTLLKLGLAMTHSEKWSSTLVFLPKIASDYKNIGSDDFYFGGYGIAKLKKRNDLIYRFGAYASTEAFGLFATPIVGVYYKSPNKLFEIDASLPISADVNYRLGKVSVGIDYFGIGRSFNISQDNFSQYYVEQSPLEFASYLQYGLLNNSILVRVKVGYTSNTHEVYEQGDKLNFRLSAFSFGDDRNQLNPDIKGSAFVKITAIYRLYIPTKETDK